MPPTIAITDVLLACSLPTPSLPDLLKEAISQDLSWEDFIASAKREGLSEIIFHNQQDTFGKGLVPEFVRSALRQEYMMTLGRNTLFLSTLDEVISALDGLDLIVLKGAYLVQHVYPSHALRRFSDIDILVHKADLVELEERLTQTEYRRVGDNADRPVDEEDSTALNSLMYRRKDGGPPLHVHWHLINSVTPKYITVNLEISAIWDNAVKNADGTLHMSTEHLIIHLAEHALRHSFNRLILMRDIAEVIETTEDAIDWTILTTACEEFNLSLPVYYSLLYVQQKGLAAIPDKALETLSKEGPGLFGKLYARYALEDSRYPELCNLAYFDMMQTVTNKRRYIAGLLFPPQELLARAYHTTPEQITFWVYIKRLLSGLSHALNALRQVFWTPA